MHFKEPSRADVLVCGEFTVLHADHCRLLQFSSTLGEVTVGLHGDAFMQLKYNDRAPSLMDRALCLAANKSVTYVTFFNEDTEAKLVSRLRPRIFVTDRPPGEALADALVSVSAQTVIRPQEREVCELSLLEFLGTRRSLSKPRLNHPLLVAT